MKNSSKGKADSEEIILIRLEGVKQGEKNTSEDRSLQFTTLLNSGLYAGVINQSPKIGNKVFPIMLLNIIISVLPL